MPLVCVCVIRAALVAQLVEHRPKTQNVAGLSPTKAAHFSSKMTVLGELHCFVLYCFGSLFVLYNRNVHIQVNVYVNV